MKPVSHLVILGAGPQQKKIYEIARSMGLPIIGVDANPDASSKYLCNYFINVSIKDAEKIIFALEALSVDFLGVLTCGAEVSVQVAKIAEHFGLTGIPVDVAVATTNKYERSKQLEQGGILIPRFEKIQCPEDITIPFPVVVKPCDSSGSRGVQLVRNHSEMATAIESSLSYSNEQYLVCEEYLAGGIEVSIEAFILNGNPIVTGIAERHFLDSADTFPQFVEIGGTMPPYFDDDLVEECKKTFCNAIRALGIVEGPSKGDLLIQDGRVFVLEVTSRTSPGFAAEMQPLNSGIHPLNILVKWATGNQIEEEELTPKFQRGVAHRYLLHSPGTVKQFSGLSDLKSSDLVDYCLELNLPKEGEKLDKINYMNRILYIITSSDDNHSASVKAEKALNLITLETDH